MENVENEEWTPIQKEAARKLVHQLFSDLRKTERNIESLDKGKFIQIFGSDEGVKHWTALLESKLSLTEYGKRHFSEEQKIEMVNYIKSE